MRFRTYEDAKFISKVQGLYYYRAGPNGYEERQQLITPEIQGDGGVIRYMRARFPAIPSDQTYKRQFWINEYGGANGLWQWEDTVSGGAPEQEIEVRPDFTTDPNKSYYLMIRVLDESGAVVSLNYPYALQSGDADKYIVGEANALLCELYKEDGTSPQRFNAKKMGLYSDVFLINMGHLPDGLYRLEVSSHIGEGEDYIFYVGGYVDYIDTAISTRASMHTEDMTQQVYDEVMAPDHGLMAIRQMEDEIKQREDEIYASVGVQGNGEGSLHEKLGAYSGGAGDNNNVKDDIANVGIASVAVSDIWSYKPTGDEGADAVASLLTEAKEKAVSNNTLLLNATYGLEALKALLDDALNRIGDTGSSSINEQVVAINSKLDDAGNGLAAIRTAIADLQEDTGDPSADSTSIYAKLNEVMAQLTDAANGLAAIQANITDNVLADTADIKARIGEDGTNTLFSRLNELLSGQAGIKGDTEAILAAINDTTSGLTAIHDLLVAVNNSLGDTATEGTITEQVQAVKALLLDANYGLQALLSQLNVLKARIGEPDASNTTLHDEMVAMQSDVDNIILQLAELHNLITDLQVDIGDPSADSTDIYTKVRAVINSLDGLIASVGIPATGEGSLHEKVGAYDGQHILSGDVALFGHNLKDDFNAVREAISITAAGMGEYLNTHNGFYDDAGNFYPVGSGPVVDDNGVPQDDVLVVAYADMDGDGLYETEVAKTFTKPDGTWLMMLDKAVYLLVFYKDGFNTVYEWRVVDPDGQLQPPNDSPQDALPSGGAA